jgi:hypothetical protein
VSGLPELPRLPEVGGGEEVEVRQYDLDVLSLWVAREPELPPPSREYWCRPLEVRYRPRRGDTLVFHPYACYSEDPRSLGGGLAQLFVYAKPAMLAAESDPGGLEELELPYYELVIAMFDDPVRVLLRDRQSTPIPVFFAPIAGGFVAVAVVKGNMYRLGARTVDNILKDIKHILNTATPAVDQEDPGKLEEEGRVLVVEVGAG